MTALCKRARRLYLSILVVAPVLLPHGAGPLLAQETEQGTRPWVRSLTLSASYSDFEAGPGSAQSFLLYLSKPDYYWIFSGGHNRLLGAEGYGYGVSYHRTWDRFRLGGGVSSGYNVDGELYPKYHVGLSGAVDVVSRVPVSLGVSRRRSAANESHTDRLGLGVRWWAPGPWLFGANTTYAMGSPGDTHSWSWGGDVTYLNWRRLHVGVNVHRGDGAYMLFPGQQVVEYNTWSYGASVTKYLSPDVGLSLSLNYTDYYGGTSIRLGFSRRW